MFKLALLLASAQAVEITSKTSALAQVKSTTKSETASKATITGKQTRMRISQLAELKNK